MWSAPNTLLVVCLTSTCIYKCGTLASQYIQILELRSRLDGLLVQRDDGGSSRSTATEALTAVTREHAALRECLGGVERVRREIDRETGITNTGLRLLPSGRLQGKHIVRSLNL